VTEALPRITGVREVCLVDGAARAGDARSIRTVAEQWEADLGFHSHGRVAGIAAPTVALTGDFLRTVLTFLEQHPIE
jgi:hypothetical protein